MVKIRTNETDEEAEEEQDNIDNKLELLKHLGEVQSPIREEITSDFVYAKLGDKDKEGVTEMTANAWLSKSYYKQMRAKATVWTFNKSLQRWEGRGVDTKTTGYMDAAGSSLFQAFMIRPYMTVILNRNVKDNHIVKLLGGAPEEDNTQGENDDNEIIEEQKKGFLKGVWDRLTRGSKPK